MASEQKNSSSYLAEVSLIRPVLIILLVLYHALAPWTGAWRPFDGFGESGAYWWIGKAAYSLMLPMFVFISGYVWAYQRETLQKKDNFRQLFARKFKRLYIPGLLFGLLYFMIFDFGHTSNDRAALLKDAVSILSGYAHMWFLPMLFWTFMIAFLILKLKNKAMQWIVVAVLCGISVIPVPLGINLAFFYLIYFFLGYESYRCSDKLKKVSKPLTIAACCIVFAVIFVITAPLQDKTATMNYDSDVIKALVLVRDNILSKLYCLPGVLGFFMISSRFTARHELAPWVARLGQYCMGIYLFQQFILQFIYYYSGLPGILCSRLLPWVSLPVTLIVCFSLTYLVRMSRIGRKMI